MSAATDHTLAAAIDPLIVAAMARIDRGSYPVLAEWQPSPWYRWCAAWRSGDRQIPDDLMDVPHIDWWVREVARTAARDALEYGVEIWCAEEARMLAEGAEYGGTLLPAAVEAGDAAARDRWHQPIAPYVAALMRTYGADPGIVATRPVTGWPDTLRRWALRDGPLAAD